MQQHVAFAGLHVLQTATPATGVARLGEVGKLGVALDHVAGLSLVVVVAQCRLYRQVDHRCIADGVPALLDRDLARLLVTDHCAADGQLTVFLDLDGISLLRRDNEVLHAGRGNPALLVALVGHRQVAAERGNHVAVVPAYAAEQFVHVVELLALQVERHPVPALLQVEVLHETVLSL